MRDAPAPPETLQPAALDFIYISPMSQPTDSQSSSPSLPIFDAPPVTAELERIAAENPTDAAALVRLANAYWLEGRGPDVVGEIATRAKTLDPQNRGAWHLWALAESSPRQRVARWQQVTVQFPEDDLARAALADNAASLAGAEHDYNALSLAIETYEQLLKTSTNSDQQRALEQAIKTLKGWRL